MHNYFLWIAVKLRVIHLQVKFWINFDYNLAQLQNRAEVNFEAKRYADVNEIRHNWFIIVDV